MRPSRVIKLLTYIAGTVIILVMSSSLLPRPAPDVSSDHVRLWVDIPNSFPWRYCLREYNGVTTLVACEKDDRNQIFKRKKALAGEISTQFHLHYTEHECVEPDDDLIVVVRDCTLGWWSWEESGRLVWREREGEVGRCFTSIKNNEIIVMKPCEELNENQYTEFGDYLEDRGKTELMPLCPACWRTRQDNLRAKELLEHRKVVSEALREISDREVASLGIAPAGQRRAAVFYADSKQAIKYLKWWIYAWRFIGLDIEEEAFDIVVMVDPDTVEDLPDDCKEYSKQFSPQAAGPGQCIYKQFEGIASRDSSYDVNMNSLDCNTGPGTDFLEEYKLLLKADIDTFPSPYLLGFWPDQVVVNRFYGTTHGSANVERMLLDTATAAGIEHKGWYNLGSSWYGDSRRIRNMARLTVALYKFAKSFMFGPGTTCRCATCTYLPNECEWGYGPYAGVMSLYLQEIALNRLWTDDEWNNQTFAVLDLGTTDTEVNICQAALLHAMHNDQPFSKFAFLSGRYDAWDMATLNLTNIRDFSMFIALDSAGIGLNRDVALKTLNNTLKGRTFAQYCESVYKSAQHVSSAKT